MSDSTIRQATDLLHVEHRSLIFSSAPRVRAMLGTALQNAGLCTFECSSVEQVCAALEHGAACALMSGSALDEAAVARIAAILSRQPAWSDVPIILLISTGRDGTIQEHRQKLFAPLGNVTIIDQPVRELTLVTTVRSALRARERQYQMRDLLAAKSLAEERLRTTIESAVDYAIINLARDGKITRWNSGAQNLFGYGEAEILGSPGSILLTRQDRESGVFERELDTARRLGRVDDERWHLRKDGSVFWSSGVVSSLKDRDGVPPGFLKVSRDATDRHLAEVRLEQHAEVLERSNEELRQFAFAAAHDLQEPLRMIIAYSQLMEKALDGGLDERTAQMLRFILDGGHRMKELTDGLLAYSRALHEIDDPLEPVDAKAVLDKALLNLEAAIREKDASVNSQSLPRVVVHEVHLLQLFQNLIANSLKYSRIDVAPQVSVSATCQSGTARFSVADNGIGIPEEYRSTVFRIFKRLHGREYSGAGIGLAICQKIVNRYGGNIWVDSGLGSGTIFHFTLPAMPA